MPPIASYIPGKVKSKGISASAKIIQELFETRQAPKVLDISDFGAVMIIIYEDVFAFDHEF